MRAVHPSPLSASRGFFDCHHFKKSNEWLLERYGPDGVINWALDPNNKIAEIEKIKSKKEEKKEVKIAEIEEIKSTKEETTEGVKNAEDKQEDVKNVEEKEEVVKTAELKTSEESEKENTKPDAETA